MSGMAQACARNLSGLAFCKAHDAANGYCFAKPQGKPNFTIGKFSLRRRRFCDSTLGGTVPAFTSRSSRTLNCSSNLIGNDHPNNRPENGVADNRV